MVDRRMIREFYRRNATAIYAAGADGWGVDPYAWDHELGIRLTPIEYGLWCDLRYVSVIVYPQYPVAGYFVDFGNPVAKVAIECDGSQWHTDVGRDKMRQREIEAQGWTVYRFTGRECFEAGKEDENGIFREGETYARVKEIAERHSIRLSYNKQRSRAQMSALYKSAESWAK